MVLSTPTHRHNQHQVDDWLIGWLSWLVGWLAVGWLAGWWVGWLVDSSLAVWNPRGRRQRAGGFP